MRNIFQIEHSQAGRIKNSFQEINFVRSIVVLAAL